MTRLEDVCDISSGGTPSRGKPHYYRGDIPWAKISDIENAKDGILLETEEHISREGLQSIGNRIFPKGTLLFAMYGSIGKVAITGRELSTNQAILGIRPKSSKEIYLPYLRVWFERNKQNLVNQGRGVALQNLSATIVRNLMVPLPPWEDQLRIADILTKAESLIAQRKESIRLLDELLKSTFLEMFGDPVRNEKGWDIKPLRMITKVGTGGTPSRKRGVEFYDGKYFWAKTTEVKGTKIFDTEEKITVLALRESNCKLYPINTILLAMYGQGKTRGNVGLLKIEAATNQACAAIPPSKSVNQVYLFELLRNSYLNLRSLARGGNQENLNLNIVGSYPIILPPLKLQARFAVSVEKTEALKAHYQESMNDLENLYGALSQGVFGNQSNGK